MSSSEKLAAFHKKLALWRILAGQPSLRAMAQEVGWSHATIGRAFSGSSVPRWDIVEALTKHLRGDVSEIRSLWMACIENETLDPNDPVTLNYKFPKVSGTVALCVFIFTVTFQGIVAGNWIWSQSINDFMQIFCAAAASGKWLVNFMHRRDRISFALSIGMTGWSLGQVFWFLCRDVFEIQFPASPTIGDAGYILLPLCVITSFISRLTYRSVIAFVTAVIFGTIGCSALLHGIVGAPLGFATTYSFYWTTDIGMFLLFACAFRQERTWSLGLGSLAMLMLLPSDLLLLSFGAFHGEKPIPYGVYTGYVAFTLLMSVSADCLRAETRETSANSEAYRRSSARG